MCVRESARERESENGKDWKAERQREKEREADRESENDKDWEAVRQV